MNYFNFKFPRLPLYFRSFSSELSYVSFIALLVQVCFVYFFTGLAKIQGDLWLNGTAVYYVMRVDEFRHTSFNIPLTENHYFVVFSTYLTWLWELSFIFLVWFKKTKFYILIIGCLLHIGIWIFMRIDNFSLIMIGTYFMFVTNNEYLLFFKRINRMVSKPVEIVS